MFGRSNNYIFIELEIQTNNNNEWSKLNTILRTNCSSLSIKYVNESILALYIDRRQS